MIWNADILHYLGLVDKNALKKTKIRFKHFPFIFLIVFMSKKQVAFLVVQAIVIGT